MSGLYAADGSINVSVVSASGSQLYASDGSWNVIHVDGVGVVDTTTGALRVTLTTSNQNSLYAPDGSRYISVSPYKTNTIRITVVSGSFGPPPSGGLYYPWIFI